MALLSLFYFDISVNTLLNDNFWKSMDNIQKLGQSKKVKWIHVVHCCCCCWVASVVSNSVRPHRTAAHQAPPSLGFSRQEHWSRLSFPSPMQESEKWKWSGSVVSDSSWPLDYSLPGSSIHGIFQARVLEWVAIAFSGCTIMLQYKSVSCFSHVQLFATPWTVTCQAPLSMEFSWQKYWSGYPYLSPVDLPNPGIEPGSPALRTDFFIIWAMEPILKYL